MKHAILAMAVFMTACGSLDKQSIMVDPGDSKDRVVERMGVPHDRQFNGKNEAWQYCQTGAGFGYNDHRIIWFTEGKVSGMTSFKTHGPPSCVTRTKTINWEERPDFILETRKR